MSESPLAEQLLRNSYCFLPADYNARKRLVREMFHAFQAFLNLSAEERALHTLTLSRGANVSGLPLEPDDGYLPPKVGKDQKHALHTRADWENQFRAREIEVNTFFDIAMKRALTIGAMIQDDYERIFAQLDAHPALKGYNLSLQAAYADDPTLSVVRCLQYFASTAQPGEGAAVVGKSHQDRSFGTRHLYQDSGALEICRTDGSKPNARWEQIDVPRGMDFFFLGMKAALATGAEMQQAENGQPHTVGGDLQALWHRGVVVKPGEQRRVVVSFVHPDHDVLS